MSLSLRDGSFDVLVVAGPRIHAWPSVGVRALSKICSEVGLTVGLFGGSDLVGRGVIPLPGTGGLVLVEDVQHRIHRFRARAVVRLATPLFLPDPFPGWMSQGLVPFSTAIRLARESKVSWNPATVLIGAGNRALRFGRQLLEKEMSNEVFCLQSSRERFRNWEVERRAFALAGGKLIRAEPLSLTRKSALVWELRVKDEVGVRVIDTARVVAVGDSQSERGFREYPHGSFLFELVLTAAMTREEDVEGWALEEENGRLLASKIAKALSTSLPEKTRDRLETGLRRSRQRVGHLYGKEFSFFEPQFDGKWMSARDLERIQKFEGVPQERHRKAVMASLECLEGIPCNLCEISCPEGAIRIRRKRKGRPNGSFLNESKCTGCGACVNACPSEAVSLVREKEDGAFSELTLSWRGKRAWNEGELAILLNRQGEALGSARVSRVQNEENQLVGLDVPSHLFWEARGIRRNKRGSVDDDSYMVGLYDSEGDEPVEISLDAEKRLVRENSILSLALFEIGQCRPQDVLLCPDGTCGLCEAEVDGVKKLACQTRTRAGMVVRLRTRGSQPDEEQSLCPCLGIASEEIVRRLKQGGLRSPEAVLAVTRVGEGMCRGQFCMGPFKRLLAKNGIETSEWIDWRFPWSEWRVRK